jgi:hypothetical protein
MPTRSVIDCVTPICSGVSRTHAGTVAASGKMKWRYAASKPLLGAVTATAGDVVLTGELSGDLVALDGKSPAGRVDKLAASHGEAWSVE